MLSCTPQPVDYGLGEYYVEIVTALGDNAYRLDSGETIYAVRKETDKPFEAGDRVYLTFSYLDNHSVRLHGASKIAQGDLKALSGEEIQQQADDPIRLVSAWTGSYYLNLQFYMEYNSQSHKIALVTHEWNVNEPEVDLFFRHDPNNDPPGYPAKVYVSYDLSKVLGEPQGNRIIRIHFNTINYGNKTCQFKY
jgi:hypothetical protein